MRLRNLVLSVFFGALLIASQPAFAQVSDITDEFTILKTGNFMNPSAAPNLPETFSQRKQNPAALADLRSQIFHAHYASFLDTVASPDLIGHSAGLGYLTPLQAGTLSLSAHLATFTTPTWFQGSWLEIAAAYSNDLAPGLNLGVALRGQFGGVRELSDAGIFLDIAVKHLFELGSGVPAVLDLGISGLGKDLRIGGDILESAFTPWAAFAFSLGDSAVSFGPIIALSAPSFQNLRGQLGLDLSFFSLVDLRVQSSFDLAKMLNESSLRSLLPGFSLAIRIPLAGESRAADDRVSISASAALWKDDVLGLGIDASIPAGNADRTAPEIITQIADSIWLSPNNDGINDRVEMPIQLKDQSPIKDLAVIVLDSEGQPLLVQRRESIPTEIMNLESFFSAWFGEASAVRSDQVFVVDGRDGNEGSMAVLPDGRYNLEIQAVDLPGNIARQSAAELIIDTQKPMVILEQPAPEERIFSPNNDGQKDSFFFNLETSVEDLWLAEIRDASGEKVRNFRVQNAAIARLEWDGLADDGSKLPDGVYEFAISSTDLAGNRSSAELSNIILNSVISPVYLTLSGPAFSPNGDGIQDTLSFRTELAKRDAAVSWELRVLNSKGETQRIFQGSGVPQDSLTFDGRGSDGLLLPEAEYKAALSVLYSSGNTSKALSPSFVLDISPPYAQIAKEFSIFSPDGNGERDTMLIYQEASVEETWTGTVYNSEGQVVFEKTWTGEPDFRFEWDGLSSDTATLPNDDYQYTLASKDPAGNSFTTEPLGFTLDTSQSLYFIALSGRAFSPNADGIRDSLEISIEQRNDVQISHSEIQILDAADKPIRRFSFNAQVPTRLSWDGKSQDGSPAPDGQYRIQLDVQHLNGTGFSSTTGTVLLDTVFPRLGIRVADSIFSPDGDGNKDSILVLPSSSEEDNITVSILAASGETIHSRSFQRNAENFEWDGTNNIGNIAENGYYRARISASDSAGNASTALSDYFALDTRVASAFITLGSKGLSPNGDGHFDTIEFGLYLNLLEGLESWKLDIRNSSNMTIRSFTGNQAKDQFIISWDGKNNSGQYVPDTYQAVFSARYAKGDAPEATSSTFILDRAGPDLRLSAAPLPFSPDNDGVDDEVGFDVQVNDLSGISVWTLQIFDRSGILVQEYRGESAIDSKLYWDGISISGERVLAAEDYTYTLSAYDTFGNFSSLEGVISTDIFVIRQGDKLYIQIASMSFLPNSPSLVLNEADPIGQRNSLILGRLVALFERYPSYRITIEGHAVNITGTELEQTRELIPLALSRAQSVREALIARGMSPNRIGTVGIGGARPLVPHSDAENRWKNRRVEFILEK